MTAIHVAAQRDPRWSDSASCAGIGPGLFYPERGEPNSEATAVCARCPVSAECLEYALANHEKYGVWGGTSEAGRRRLRKERRAARQAGEAA